MGNAQTSICFRVSFKRGSDQNDRNAVRKLWPIIIKDIDYQTHRLGDFMEGKKACMIVNVASH